MKKIIRLYIGCGLTQAPPEFVAEVDRFKESLQAEYHIYHFMGLEGGTNQDVYRRDIEVCVAECDLFVAICDYPSIGLGYELATAVEALGKPTLAVAHRDSKITRLIQGVPLPKFEFRRYNELEDVKGFIRDKASGLLMPNPA